MTPTRHRLGNEHGFTLAELLVAIAVIGLVMAAVFMVQRGGLQAYLLGSSRVETQQNARVALDLMIRELRSATSILAVSGGTNITFLDQCRNNVGYALAPADDSQLNRTGPDYTDRSNCLFDTTSATPVIRGVQAFTLASYFYDPASNSYKPTTIPAQIEVVNIKLVTKNEESVAPGSPGDQRATVESTVQLRNRS